MSGTYLIEDCLFEGNGPSQYGGALHLAGCDVVMRDTQFRGNVSTFRGGAVSLWNSNGLFEGCTWEGNESVFGGALSVRGEAATVNECTFVGNSASRGSGVYVSAEGNVQMDRSLLAFGEVGTPVDCEGSTLSAEHSDVYGNADGDWVGCLDGLLGIDGNISADPLFCDASNSEYYINYGSPCAGGVSVYANTIGAWPVRCGLEPPRRLALSASVPMESVGILRSLPNPFSYATEILYNLPENGADTDELKITIFDTTGRQIRTLTGIPAGPGSHRVVWDGRSDAGQRAGAGVFFVRINLPGFEDGVRLTLVR